TNSLSELRAEHALQRLMLRRHDMDLDVPMAKRSGDFETDEARPDHEGAAGVLGLSDDGARILERTKDMDMRLIRSGYIEADRFASGRQQQPVELDALAIAQGHSPRRGVDRRC